MSTNSGQFVLIGPYSLPGQPRFTEDARKNYVDTEGIEPTFFPPVTWMKSPFLVILTILVVAAVVCVLTPGKLSSRGNDDTSSARVERSHKSQARQSRDDSKALQKTKTRYFSEKDQDSYYWRRSNSGGRTSVTKEEAIARIKEGLGRMRRGITPYPLDEPLTDIDVGYQRLRSYASFLGPNQPTIGMEYEDYYVFTLFPSQKPEEAFLRSWLVRKKDGMLFQWIPKK